MSRTISVIIPCYNKVETIGKCLDSILAQENVDTEIIVVDDASNDRSRNVIERYGGKVDMVIYHNSSSPLGCQHSCNQAVDKAKQEMLFFCDADLVLEKDCLAKLSSNIGAEDICYCDYNRRGAFNDGPFIAGEFSLRRLVLKNFISQNSLVRKDSFPGFDSDLGMLWDWDCWLTMCLWQGAKANYVPESLFTAYYKEGDNSLQKKEACDYWYNTIKNKYINEAMRFLENDFVN